MPDHSILTGHLLVVKQALGTIPKDCNPFLVFGEMARLFPHGVFYLDLWPFSSPFVIATSLNAATQATQQTKIAYNRPSKLLRYFKPITGGPNLFSMPEQDRKPVRATFNSAFSNKSVAGFMEHIVGESLVYRPILAGNARKRNLIEMDTVTLHFTMNLIGRTIL